MRQPVMIEIKKGIYLNLNNVITCGAERGMSLRRVKEGINPREAKANDYEEYTADTVVFHYVNNQSLYFRVGYEIEEANFVYIEKVLQKMAYILNE